jgi:hypothetical protein
MLGDIEKNLGGRPVKTTDTMAGVLTLSKLNINYKQSHH